MKFTDCILHIIFVSQEWNRTLFFLNSNISNVTYYNLTSNILNKKKNKKKQPSVSETEMARNKFENDFYDISLLFLNADIICP